MGRDFIDHQNQKKTLDVLVKRINKIWAKEIPHMNYSKQETQCSFLGRLGDKITSHHSAKEQPHTKTLNLTYQQVSE